MAVAPEPSDEALFANYRAGDAAAFEALFRRWQEPLGRHLVRMLDDPAAADDLVMETFLRLHRHRARWREGTLMCLQRLMSSAAVAEKDRRVPTGPCGAQGSADPRAASRYRALAMLNDRGSRTGTIGTDREERPTRHVRRQRRGRDCPRPAEGVPGRDQKRAGDLRRRAARLPFVAAARAWIQ